MFLLVCVCLFTWVLQERHLLGVNLSWDITRLCSYTSDTSLPSPRAHTHLYCVSKASHAQWIAQRWRSLHGTGLAMIKPSLAKPQAPENKIKRRESWGQLPWLPLTPSSLICKTGIGTEFTLLNLSLPKPSFRLLSKPDIRPLCPSRIGVPWICLHLTEYVIKTEALPSVKDSTPLTEYPAQVLVCAEWDEAAQNAEWKPSVSLVSRRKWTPH